MTAAETLRLRRRVESAVRSFMDAAALWPAGGRLLVAVSGGPDSTALLLILTQLARRHPLHLTAAYFDHALRGEAASRAERDAVESLCAAAGVDLLTGRGDIPARAATEKLGPEAAARAERYAFLANAARESGSSAVATGHTASDQAETVLLHVLRGAGLGGLGGIAASAAWPFAADDAPRLIRPLLAVTRDDTLAYCRAAGVTPIEDESNASPDYLRNRLRHELLPVLRQYNPAVDQALVRLADAARQDAAYIDSQAATALSRRAGRVALPRGLVAAWPASPRRHALRLALAAIAGDREGFAADHVEALERLLLKGRTGDRLDLPRGVSASLMRHDLKLRPAAAPGPEALPAEPVSLNVPGRAGFGPLIVAAGAASSPAAPCATSVEVDAEAAGAVLSVRRRRPGDRLQPLGMAGAKKLQDLFVDAHLPRVERDSVPIFANQRGILWVGGLRIAEWAKPRPGHATIRLAYQSATD